MRSKPFLFLTTVESVNYEAHPMVLYQHVKINKIFDMQHDYVLKKMILDLGQHS